MHKNLLNLFGQIKELDQEEIDFIKSNFKALHLKKGDYFLKSGEVCEHIAFLDQGLVRYFVFKDDEESTFEFTKEGEFIGDYQSFSKKSSTVQNIQAIEDCDLFVIDYPSTQNFYSLANGNLMGRHLIEHRFDIMVKQLLSIYMHNHEERYSSFIEKYADLAQRIPQYLIASYVGVKAPSLSRIRKRFTESNS